MLKLVIGNKNYSSWSMRPWLALRANEIPFEEVFVPLYTDNKADKDRILSFSRAGKVPALIDGDVTVWDSLSIIEYLAEKFPQAKLWPEDRTARGHARSISAEMHSGFPNLRNHMSMNVRKHYPGKGRTPDVENEIQRIIDIWSAAQKPFLFGPFGAADAMYAPVVLRFRTYEVELPGPCRAYADAVLALPAMREWIAAAERERESIPQFELYG